MGKKLILYLSLFIIVLSINFYLISASFDRMKRTEESRKILSEIDPRGESGYSAAPFVANAIDTNVSTGDSRAKNLKIFFRKYNSDLYYVADYLVNISDKYNFDYRLLPAIAMQESNLCKYIPPDSHNCWGWGIYGDTTTKFDNYRDAIDAVAQGIKSDYLDQGLLTASAIMQKYTPTSNGSWARGVNNVLGWLE